MKRVVLLMVVTVAAAVASGALASPAPTGVVWRQAAGAGTTTQATGPIVSPWIYLDRCTGGCTIHGTGLDNAQAQTSSIPCSGGATCTGGACSCPTDTAQDYMVAEYHDGSGNTGSAADAEWAQVVACVQQVYSPFNVTVTDQIPPGGVSYNEGIVAGTAADIGYGSVGLGGIAPGGCDAHDNAVSFTFANEPFYNGSTRVLEICGVAAQETAHAYGLEHEYQYLDKTPACNDPMTYVPSCGQQFFRNETAICGEYAPRACVCGGGYQNSHLKILSVFGAGTPITTAPTVAFTIQTAGGPTYPSRTQIALAATATAQRGVATIELWINGYKWTTTTSQPEGQPEPPITPTIVFPEGVPDGVMDVQLKAYDDINVEGDSPITTITVGSPCSSAASCATGQQCSSDGKCSWATPIGNLGDACTYSQFCTSGICDGPTNGQICTMDCITGEDGCPTGYDCIATSAAQGICYPPGGSGGGCCSTSSGGAPVGQGLLSFAVIGLVLRRRRRAV
jgi:hypothetical protein